MVNSADSFQPTKPAAEGVLIAARWMLFYLITFSILFVTMPVTSHSDNWSGIVPGFAILMFGAYRLAEASATTSTIFIYGCGASFYFLFRFFAMGRLSLWLHYQAPSDAGLALMWLTICLFLGTSAVVISKLLCSVLMN